MIDSTKNLLCCTIAGQRAKINFLPSRILIIFSSEPPQNAPFNMLSFRVQNCQVLKYSTWGFFYLFDTSMIILTFLLQSNGQLITFYNNKKYKNIRLIFCLLNTFLNAFKNLWFIKQFLQGF